MVLCTVEESGQHVISTTGFLHLETCLTAITNFLDGADYWSSRTVTSTSQNKHNKLYMQARPLEDGLAQAIDKGRIGPRDGLKVCLEILSEEFAWDKDLAKKIWCFGPETTGPNMVVDMCKGVQHLNEIKDSVMVGFQWASKEGALCEQNMRGICFELCDASVHFDSIQSGSDQIIPIARRAFYAAQLTAKPWLMEPIYLAEIQAPEQALGGVYRAMKKHRGHVFEIIQTPGNPLFNIKTYLPVIESLTDCTWHLNHETAGKASMQCVVDHWELMPSDPLEFGSQASQLVSNIRYSKGLSDEMTTVSEYEDNPDIEQ